MPTRLSSTLWTAANGIMLGLFVFSTCLQFNDPDAPRWVAVYAAAAVMSALEMRRRAPIWAAAALMLVAIVWAWFISRDVHGVPFASMFAQWEMKNEQIEESRETYGLGIVAAWMIAILVAAVRRRRGPIAP